MLTITSSRLKKSLLHPGAAISYLKNYLKGRLIRIRSNKKLSDRIAKNLNYVEWEIGDLIEDAAGEPFILEAADRVLSNEFSFLGLTTKPLQEIEWREDLKSRHIWPNDFYLDLREQLIKDYNKGWDIKYVWELSRFHYLMPLALAFYQTGENKYLEKWQTLIADWIQNNQVYYGPNWMNAMEVAIRACNWILSFEIIQKQFSRSISDVKQKSSRKTQVRSSKPISGDFLQMFLASLHEHGRFIFNNLEYAPIRSNHYLSDLTGLIYLSCFLEGRADILKWKKFSLKALEEEMKYQVYEDGVDYELSTSYHRYVLELFLWAGYILKINNIDLSHAFWLKLGKMLNFILAIIKPNGLMPQIGDSDDSRLHLVWENYYSWEKRSCNALIKLFALVTQKPLENYPLTSQSFTRAGFYLLKNNGFYLITGRHQACYGKGGSHTHNDLLSFELAMKSDDLIIDSGTYTYSADLAERNRFRSTRAHNNAIIDGQEQEILATDPFWIGQKAKLIKLPVEGGAEEMSLTLEQTAYTRLKYPAIHQRAFIFNKQGTFAIQDRFRGRGRHEVEWNFHLSPAVKLWVKNNTASQRELIFFGKNNKFIFSFPGVLTYAIIKDEISSSYGVKISSRTLRFFGFLNLDNKDGGKNASEEFEFTITPVP